ncbi:ER lumen protein-retaining receptor-like [Phymastichus coffea]|uniref:ER lumen protein-retaining receptor-like n=1 Tax=Phymastichus coffea TaxID=108790 RepID=UPI00273A787C|nr:ER lumen protein-retaining receptor-like [Phymastichus coffea]
MLDKIYWVGSYLHLLAMIALLVKIWATQDCTGISIKSQFLYAVVFTTRYLDVFTTFISRENTFFKIIYILLTYVTLFSMTFLFWKTYEKKYDIARLEILMIPCIVIALLVNYEFSYLEILWTFSIYLEAVAMVPQFHFVHRSKRIHKHIICYIAAICIYKALYIAHWAYQYFYQSHHYDKLSLSAGMVQLVLYCDFFRCILPLLFNGKMHDVQPTVATIEVNVENGIPKTGHLTNNVSTIVLTPTFLTGVDNDKKNLLTTEKTVEKY